MKDGQYESRKEQIERGFMRELRRDLKESGVVLSLSPRSAETVIKKALRNAAMVGAVEERDRTLKLLRDRVSPHLINSITADSVMKVLGYE